MSPALLVAIRDAAPARIQPGHRGDVDDAPGPALLEMRRGGAGHEVRAPQVGGEELVPHLGIERFEIGERDADVPGRVVDEHVETAEVLGHRLTAGGMASALV
jgi:hypothetical protein